MIPEERQALREKHQENNGRCQECVIDAGHHFPSVEYPCDVIKVLDATENLKPNDLKTKVERSKILAVIHVYDETPESKLARIWEVLGREA